MKIFNNMPKITLFQLKKQVDELYEICLKNNKINLNDVNIYFIDNIMNVHIQKPAIVHKVNVEISCNDDINILKKLGLK